VQRSEFVRAAAACAAAASPAAALAQTPSPQSRIAALERRTGGRLGVYAVDTGGGRRIEHRGYEVFPMCSTFKTLAVAAVLARVDAGTLQLSRRIAYGKSDLLEYAPVTTAHAAEGSMTIRALCEAAIEQSDNTAANLLVGVLGGRNGYNDFVRSIGDRFTQLDRIEPYLNDAVPGDIRDSTTPNAMGKDYVKLLLGTSLSRASQALLASWLVACETGGSRIRAGIPASWKAGDKTGTGGHGTSNDVAILWPPGRAPIVVAAYLTGATVSRDGQNDALAEVGRIVAAAFA
jgi:beta-lactamase class A